MEVWMGDIELPGGGRIENVELVSEKSVAFSISRTPLQFLSIVDMTRIPLYMAIGSPLEVYSERQSTQDWFGTLLLDNCSGDTGLEAQWWQDFQYQSPVGIMAKAHGGSKGAPGPRLTEVLFFVSAEPKGLGSSFSRTASQAPAIRLLALPLSSDLLHQSPTQSTPPLSPNTSPASKEKELAQFLPQPAASATPKSRKRESISNIFDEAAERRKRARRKGGESMAAAASRAIESIPQLKRTASSAHVEPPLDPIGRRTSPNASFNHPAIKSSRSLSRSPSLNLEIRPVSRREGLDNHAKLSSLSRVASVADINGEPNIESRNKDTISRLVMAGMRMYGLHQRKRSNKAHARRASVAPGVDSQTGHQDEDVTPEDAARDEEYKLVYHQTYRGAVFAMRTHISTQPLGQNVDELRDVVDRLLAIFCNDPLASHAQSPDAAPTLGDVQVSFGTPNPSNYGSPFVEQADHFNGSGNLVHTPVVRRTSR